MQRNRASVHIDIAVPATVPTTTIMAAIALAMESDAIKQLPGATEIQSISVDVEEIEE